MEYVEQLNVKIIDTVLDPDRYGIEPGGDKIKEMVPEVRYHSSGDLYLYKVWIFLAGEDLPRVKSVTYQLHETFPEPVRTVQRTPSNQDCRLVLWTWGVFQINATIMDQAGRSYILSHYMVYDQILKDYKDNLRS